MWKEQYPNQSCYKNLDHLTFIWEKYPGQCFSKPFSFLTVSKNEQLFNVSSESLSSAQRLQKNESVIPYPAVFLDICVCVCVWTATLGTNNKVVYIRCAALLIESLPLFVLLITLLLTG